MRIIILASLIFSLCLLPQGARSKGKIYVNRSRLVEITGQVNDLIIMKADKLDQLTRTSSEDVYIFINSPGGLVSSGVQFLDAMLVAQSRGVNLICVVSVMAASMAFSILTQCDERYALRYSLLLWHPIKIGGAFKAFSADQMEYYIKVMRAWELPLNDKAIKSLNISKKLFYYHYSHETLFITTQLQTISPNFISIVDDIVGVRRLFSK